MGTVSAPTICEASLTLCSFLGFIACCLGGMACFAIAFLFLPIREC
jgi:hypothetical protein